MAAFPLLERFAAIVERKWLARTDFPQSRVLSPLSGTYGARDGSKGERNVFFSFFLETRLFGYGVARRGYRRHNEALIGQFVPQSPHAEPWTVVK